MIRKAVGEQDARSAAKLACMLWESHEFDEMTEEMHGFIADKESAVFLAFEKEEAVGFAQCALRRDYVEGTNTSPVGFLEGVFVREEYRRRGIAKALVKACENWAKESGCTEFGSDCEIDNLESQRFHEHIGFAEVGRTVWFAKKI